MTDKAPTAEYLPPQPRSRHGFRIAIICALPLEAEMVELMLDHDWHDSGARYGKAAGDKNTYTTGVIARHNVVLAYMPSMGGIDAAGVATGLRSSFPKIEFAFVVGICGAVPKHPSTKQDIFLGDCIISTSVVQYDLGAQYPAGFKKKAGLDSLGRASQEVRSLIVKLNTYRNQEQLTKRMRLHLGHLIQVFPNMKFPGTERDRLFQPTYVHRHVNPECDSCRKDVDTCSNDCDSIGCDPEFTIYRERLPLEPRVHFGCFGSASTVMKSGKHRDEIAGKELIAFEMESAGVWDAFPTIVIKSACDYADSHKSKEWQGYAAGSAAAGLKAVLEKLELSDEEIIQDSQLPAKDSNELNEIETECLQSLCLQPSYRDMKDRTAGRVAGTCNWALSQDTYLNWLRLDGAKLLVSADPGCGKSVLAKYLIEEELPRVLPGFIICYYFFEDQVQNKLVPALCAICHQLMVQDYNLLRKYAVPCYRKDPNMASDFGTLVDVIRKSVSDKTSHPFVIVFDALDECEPRDCKRLIGMLEQLDGAKKLKIILTSRPYYGIVSNFETVSSRLHIPGEEESDAISKEVEIVIKQRLEILCRQKKFDRSIRSELESRLLSQGHRTYLWTHLVFEELDTSLKMTARELRIFFGSLPRSVNEAYERILSKYAHDPSTRNTVQTTLSVLLAAYEPLTIRQLQHAIKTRMLPDARILTDLDIEPDRDFIVKLRDWCGLFIQVYNKKVTFIHQTAREFLISSGMTDIQMVRGNELWMGSCTIKKAHEVMAGACIAYLLLFSKLSQESKFHLQEFLGYAGQYWDKHVRDGACTNDKELLKRMTSLCGTRRSLNIWLRYRAELVDWLNKRCMSYREFIKSITHLQVVALLQMDTLIGPKLVDAHIETKEFNDVLPMAATLGHPENLRSLLNYATEHTIQVDLSSTLVFQAIEGQRADCLKILLEYGASISKNCDGHVHLIHAISLKSLDMVKLLVQYGASLEERDHRGYSPLYCAVVAKLYAVTAYLLDHGANVHVRGEGRQTCLHEAVLRSAHEFVLVLLTHGANIKARDQAGSTPLHIAAIMGCCSTITMLLRHGAEIDARNNEGMTPLARTVCGRHLEAVKILLQNYADVNHQDNHGRSILHHAISPQLRRDGLISMYDIFWYDLHSDNEIKSFLDRERDCGYDLIRLLLKHGARLDLRDEDGYTPLSLAIHYQMEETVNILLDYKKELSLACIKSDVPYICIQEHHPFLLKFLSNSGHNISIQYEKGSWFVHGLLRDCNGEPILHIACYVWSKNIIRLIADSQRIGNQNMEPWRHASSNDSEDPLENGAVSLTYSQYVKVARLISGHNIDLQSHDVLGCNSLLSYSRFGCEWAVKRLLDYGFDIGCKDIYGGTPLHWASCYGSEKVLRLLLEHGADINACQDSGFTALTVAMLHGNFEIFTFLLKRNANPEIPDIHGRRLVHHAVCLESDSLATTFLSYLLQTQNVDIDAKDHGGWTALHWASAKDFKAAVIELLKYKASLNVKDDRGRTPLDYAKVSGHKGVVALLVQDESEA